MNLKEVIDMEELNDKYFKRWNKAYKFFVIPEDDNPLDCSIIDKHVVDCKGRECAIELKTRFCDINTYDTLFLEQKKMDVMKEEFNNGKIPLYINFFRDGNHVWLCNLAQFFDGKHQLEKKEVTVCNYGYETMDYNQTRYLIPIRTGNYYEYDEKNKRFNRLW